MSSPPGPATGFGYIRAGEPLAGAATALHAVEFVEKPDAVRAAEYVASGEFRWNAGMFVVRASTLLDLLEQWHPELAAGLRSIAADPSLLDDVWPGLTRIAIDHAVAEPAADAGRVVVVPAPFEWDDVGDFASLATLLPASGGGEVGGSATCGCSATARTSWRSTPGEWWCPRAVGGSRSWGWTTSWWSTPPTRCS